MSFSGNKEMFTLVADADLSGKQYHIMRQSGALTCNVASNATESSNCGILQNKPQSGEHATIADKGTSKVVAGGAITAGDHLAVNGSGRAAAAGSGDMAIGRALETAGANGDVIAARIYTPVRWSGAV